MTKYINREALIEWLKRIPLKDLSDGLGLCRVIFEDDFKKAIKNMPKGIIVDAVPVVRCKDCKHWHKDTVFCGYMPYGEAPKRVNWYADDFCSYGERKDGDGNGAD